MIVIPGVELVELNLFSDDRGSLCFVEVGHHIHFEIKRSFWVFDTPENAIRGHHAHRESRQAHVCMAGSATIVVDNGREKAEVLLDTRNQVLLLEPMIWHSFCLEKGSLLFVFTSDLYDEADYIRNYDKFLKMVNLS